ncbi:hypothetical protein PFISCL1PPCAC_23057, partial [Pristionchus fissidentatus]
EMAPNATDPSLRDVGKKEGLDVWRINKNTLEPVVATQQGVFYDGDAYVVLNTKKGADAWDVHFWIGKNASAEEMGTAASKTVEIDQALGGFPTQYREVQGHESALFLSYFKNNLRYPTGGYDSGFDTIDDLLKNFKPKLYKCKGKRNVRCTEVKLGKSSLNLGDVFILDVGEKIYVWMPPESGRLEKIKGMTRAKNIADNERAGRTKVVPLDDEWNKNSDFWSHFGGKEVIASIDKAQDDDTNFWERNKDQVTLWKVSDASGEATVKWLAQGEDVKQNLLDSNDAFILDAVNGGIYVWVGKGCSLDERSKAFHWGQCYLNQQHLPPWTAVSRVVESTEPQLFTQWFADWHGAMKTGEFEPRLFQCSNESGKLIVEEIVGFDQEDLDGDDVMVLDAFNTIYVWVGAGANAEEKKYAETTAKDYLSNGTVKRPKQTHTETLFQGQESPTFKKFFPAWDDKMFKEQNRSVANMRKLLFH